MSTYRIAAIAVLVGTAIFYSVFKSAGFLLWWATGLKYIDGGEGVPIEQSDQTVLIISNWLSRIGDWCLIIGFAGGIALAMHRVIRNQKKGGGKTKVPRTDSRID